MVCNFVALVPEELRRRQPHVEHFVQCDASPLLIEVSSPNLESSGFPQMVTKRDQILWANVKRVASF